MVRSVDELSLTGHIRVSCQLATLERFGKKVKNTYAVPDDYIRRNKEGVVGKGKGRIETKIIGH